MKRSVYRKKYWTQKIEEEKKIKEEIEVDKILQEEKPKRKKVKEND